MSSRSSIAAMGKNLLVKQLSAVDDSKAAAQTDLMFLVRQSSNPAFDEDSEDSDDEFVASVVHGHRSVRSTMTEVKAKTYILDDRLVAFPAKNSSKSSVDFNFFRGARSPGDLAFYTSYFAVVGRCEEVGKGKWGIYSAIESNPTALLSVAPRHLLSTTYRLFHESTACYTFKRNRHELAFRVFEGKSSKDKSKLRFLVIWGDDDIIIKLFDKEAAGGLGSTIAKWHENGFATIAVGVDILFVLACFTLADAAKNGFACLSPSQSEKDKVQNSSQPILVRDLAQG